MEVGLSEVLINGIRKGNTAHLIWSSISDFLTLEAPSVLGGWNILDEVKP
jgi:hypothetical protein